MPPTGASGGHRKEVVSGRAHTCEIAASNASVCRPEGVSEGRAEAVQGPGPARLMQAREDAQWHWQILLASHGPERARDGMPAIVSFVQMETVASAITRHGICCCACFIGHTFPLLTCIPSVTIPDCAPSICESCTHAYIRCIHMRIDAPLGNIAARIWDPPQGLGPQRCITVVALNMSCSELRGTGSFSVVSLWWNFVPSPHRRIGEAARPEPPLYAVPLTEGEADAMTPARPVSFRCPDPACRGVTHLYHRPHRYPGTNNWQRPKCSTCKVQRPAPAYVCCECGLPATTCRCWHPQEQADQNPEATPGPESLPGQHTEGRPPRPLPATAADFERCEAAAETASATMRTFAQRAAELASDTEGWANRPGLAIDPCPAAPVEAPPTLEGATEHAIVSSINTTSLSTNAHLIQELEGVVCFQEHQLAHKYHQTTTAAFRRAGHSLTLSPPCTDGGGVAAGTGIMVRTSTHSAEPPILTAPFRRAHARGRASMRAIVFDVSMSFSVYSVYGYVGGATDAHAAARTSALLGATFTEHAAHGGGPAIIAVDLNADPAQVPFCSTLLEQAKWVDLGAVAGCLGGIDGAPTCRAPSAVKATRRDYLFMHPSLRHRVRTVHVHDDGVFATHARISVKLALRQPYWCYHASTIASMHEAYKEEEGDYATWKTTAKAAAEANYQARDAEFATVAESPDPARLWDLFGEPHDMLFQPL